MFSSISSAVCICLGLVEIAAQSVVDRLSQQRFRRRKIPLRVCLLRLIVPDSRCEQGGVGIFEAGKDIDISVPRGRRIITVGAHHTQVHLYAREPIAFVDGVAHRVHKARGGKLMFPGMAQKRRIVVAGSRSLQVSHAAKAPRASTEGRRLSTS